MFWKKSTPTAEAEATENLRAAIKEYNKAIAAVRNLKLTFAVREKGYHHSQTLYGHPLELDYIYRLHREEF